MTVFDQNRKKEGRKLLRFVELCGVSELCPVVGNHCVRERLKGHGSESSPAGAKAEADGFYCRKIKRQGG